MNTEIVRGVRPKITLIMILCGITSAASMGAVSAATAADEAPSLAFKFDPNSLATESGTREVYRRLQLAAEQACPAPVTTGTLVLSDSVQHCRDQLVSRVVHQINSPRLVALYNSRAKNS